MLLLSRVDCPSHDPGHGRWLAAHLPRATLVEHPDPNGVWFLGDVDWVLTQFAAFVGSRPVTPTGYAGFGVGCGTAGHCLSDRSPGARAGRVPSAR